MCTDAPNVTHSTEAPPSKLKRRWPLIALVIVVAALILGELAFQWAKHRGWTTYTKDDGLGGYWIGSAVEAPDGAVWLDLVGGAYRFGREGVTIYAEEDGLADHDVHHIVVASDGAIWFATDGGVSRFDGETWITYTEDDGLATNDVDTILVAPDGALWFGTRGGGVSRFDPLAKGEAWTTYTEDDGLAGNHVSTIAVARDGALWFGTGRYEKGEFLGDGVSRFDPLAKGDAWTTYTIEDGLADDIVYDIVVGPDGALWFRTAGPSGERIVSRFDGETWTFGRGEVLSITVASDGALWFESQYSVSRFNGETWDTYSSHDGLAEGRVYGIAAAPDGVVWVGSGDGLSRFDGQTWRPYTATYSGLAKGDVKSLFADSQGRVWAGAGDGLSVFDEDNSFPAQTLQVWAGAWLALRALVIALLVLPVLAWIVRLVRRRLGSRPREKVALMWLSVTLVVLLGWASKVITAGWGIILFGIPYLAIGIIHFIVHRRTISKVPEAKPSLFALVFASHAFFLLGFLLQADAGDGPDWLTITYLVGGLGSRPPTWWPEPILMNVVVFAPIVLSWVLLPRKSFYHRAAGEADQPITDLEPLAESDTEGLVDAIHHSSDPEE